MDVDGAVDSRVGDVGRRLRLGFGDEARGRGGREGGRATAVTSSQQSGVAAGEAVAVNPSQ